MSWESIAALLKSSKTEQRIRAVEKLSRLDGKEKQTLLLTALRDKSNYVATRAAEILGECADSSAMGAMRERFDYLMEDGPKRDPGCHIRANLAFAFGRLEDHFAVDLLRQGIRTVQIEAGSDTAGHLRANCALALAQMRAPDSLRDITLLLFDTSGTVEPRKAAAQALVRLGDRNAYIPLTLKLIYPGREELEVLQECMQAVIELEDPRARELLEPYLHHSDAHLAAYSALMLARTREPEVPALLAAMMPRLSGDPLRAVALALTTMRTEEARAVLHTLLSDLREATRLAVIEALTGTQDEDDRKRLTELANQDASPRVRAAAQRALELE